MKRRKIGIKTRVFLEVGAIIAVCLLGMSLVNSRLLGTFYITNTERTLSSMAQNIEEYDGSDLAVLIRDYEHTKGVSIDLYDKNDNYIYAGSGKFISGGKLSVISRTNNPDGSYFNIVATENSTMQYILFGKDFSDGRHIEIMAEKNPIEENARLGTQFTTGISIFALLLALVFIFGYAKRFTKPLIEMSEVTAGIAELDFSRKCKVERNDEIGALAESINTVSDSLAGALTELKEKNAKLEEDIEHERRLEKMRSDFISAASHELKTPIAIIRGYAEGLKLGMDENDASGQEYCDIILKESDKMNTLVLSMLEQSLYASGGKMPEPAPFKVLGTIKSYMRSMEPIFTEKGITASYECDESITAFADESQIVTVLQNYISNACSHASGDKIIKVFVTADGEKYRLNVFNSGSRVNEKDADSIFTSFYRADKAHSRAEGRFGLGLSIVRSIADNHATDCGFINNDNGVTFWFDLPKCAE